jgi:hypothetical protein
MPQAVKTMPTDWIAPFVELDHGLIISAAWAEFWLHLADKAMAAMGSFICTAISNGNAGFACRRPAFHVFRRNRCRHNGR